MKNLKLILVMAVILLGLGFSAYAVDSSDFGTGALNINTATVEELKMLPFVDSQTAQAIVDFRDSHGPFVSIDELNSVNGITRPLLIDLRSHLVLKGDSSYDPYGGL
jgi:competence ComEA-like helix-hairpin-helix protein